MSQETPRLTAIAAFRRLPPPLEAEVETAELGRLAAVVGGELERARAYYREDFLEVTASGETRTLAWLFERFESLPRELLYHQEEREIRALGSEAAVVTGLLRACQADGTVHSLSRFLHVWERGERGWRLVAGQGTPAAEALKSASHRAAAV